jgi:hypothetical protein
MTRGRCVPPAIADTLCEDAHLQRREHLRASVSLQRGRLNGDRGRDGAIRCRLRVSRLARSERQ